MPADAPNKPVYVRQTHLSQSCPTAARVEERERRVQEMCNRGTAPHSARMMVNREMAAEPRVDDLPDVARRAPEIVEERGVSPVVAAAMARKEFSA